MNLTLSLGINGVVDDVGGGRYVGDGGDRGRVARIIQARDWEVIGADGGGGGLQLMHLVLSSVAAGGVGDVRAAAAALQEVYRRASSRGGDPAQRVVAHYADALASRLTTTLRPSQPEPAAATRAEGFLAFTMFYQASPFYQFAHFTANQAIVEAFQDGGRRRLHVVDFDVSYGFQWPSLIQSLSDAATTSTRGGGCDAPVSLRITGFGAGADELRETEVRLARFATGCPNLRFEFESVLIGSNSIHDHRIKIDEDATVVVNLVFPAAQSATAASSGGACATTLDYIHSLNPSLVFLIEKDDGVGVGGGAELAAGAHNATRRSASLLPRFAANLRYFAAVFDSLHECLPADSAERLAIERDHLGREISNAVASLGADHTAAAEATSWKEAMESAGFDGVELSSRTVSQAKLLLKMKSGCGGSSGGGFRVMEGADAGRAMSLAWRDTPLITATGWRRCR